MDTFKGKVIFWRRMAPILKRFDDTDKIPAVIEKAAKMPDKH